MAPVAPVGSSMAFAQMAAAASMVANDGHSSMAYAQAAPDPKMITHMEPQCKKCFQIR